MNEEYEEGLLYTRAHGYNKLRPLQKIHDSIGHEEKRLRNGLKGQNWLFTLIGHVFLSLRLNKTFFFRALAHIIISCCVNFKK